MARLSPGTRRALGSPALLIALASLTGASGHAQNAAWLLANTPPRVVDAGMVYDTARQRLVLYGGTDSYEGDLYHDLWEWSGTDWVRRPTSSWPKAYEGSGLVYDSARRRTVLFGGRSGFPALENETWEWDGFGWTLRTPANSPAKREMHGMAYDAARGEVVLFGGNTGAAIPNEVGDTWVWDGTNWTQRFPARSPAPRAEHRMVYDTALGVVVLFGGVHPRTSVELDDTWIWDGTNWTDVSTEMRPPARCEHSMAYDSVRQRVVLYGGSLDYAPLQDTWEWDGTNWTQRPSRTVPDTDVATAMAFDPRSGRAVLYGGGRTAPLPNGGLRDDTWEWDGTDWTVGLAGPTRPPWRSGPALGYDRARRQAVLFGGSQSGMRNDTWVYDGPSWRQLAPPTLPSPREAATMVWDDARQRLVLFGGFTANGVDDQTWEWDGVTWIDRTAEVRPPARQLQGMAYDAVRQRAVLFGGQRGWAGPLAGDTWEWDGTNWLQRTPALAPSPRSGPAMAYDPVRQQVVLFGGLRNFKSLNDTWVWDGTGWSDVSSEESPPRREYHAMAWDPARQRIVMFGGYVTETDTLLNDSWEWDGSIWIQTATTGVLPQPRQRMGLVFDDRLRRMLLFGGIQPYRELTATWTYSSELARGERSGTGCAGSLGVPGLGTFGAATPGRASFALDLASARPGSPCALLLAAGRANVALGNGCALLVDPNTTVTLGGLSSSGGFASFALPLPAGTTLGATFESQGVVVDPAGAWQSLAVSGRLSVTVGF